MSDTLDDIISEIVESKISELIEGEVANQVANFADSRLDEVAQHWSYRKKISDLVDSQMPTVLGNRLRCGIYEHTEFKKAFDEHFPEAIRKQIQAEVRRLVFDECRKSVTLFFDAITKSERSIRQNYESNGKLG